MELKLTLSKKRSTPRSGHRVAIVKLLSASQSSPTMPAGLKPECKCAAVPAGLYHVIAKILNLNVCLDRLRNKLVMSLFGNDSESSSVVPL